MIVQYQIMELYSRMDTMLIQLLVLLAAQSSDEFDDPELLLRIKKGDHDAFKAFFDTYHRYLINFLLKKGTSEEAAKDLVQQAFLFIWEKREQIDENKSLRSYLFRIAYTRMLNLFRDHAKFNTEEPSDEHLPSEPESDDVEKKAQLNKDIETAISSMPGKRQEVFRLCFIQEFTYKEASEVLDISVKTIENHMGLALKDLRMALEKYK